ncbi:MAG: YIP1 family protein [archaeon]
MYMYKTKEVLSSPYRLYTRIVRHERNIWESVKYVVTIYAIFYLLSIVIETLTGSLSIIRLYALIYTPVILVFQILVFHAIGYLFNNQETLESSAQIVMYSAIPVMVGLAFVSLPFGVLILLVSEVYRLILLINGLTIIQKLPYLRSILIVAVFTAIISLVNFFLFSSIITP